MKPGTPPLRSSRLLDQVRERIRYKHYSLRTEESYVYWVRFYVRWSGLGHPRDMGAAEVEAFLAMLATQRKVSAATHNQALSALLFLPCSPRGLAGAPAVWHRHAIVVREGKGGKDSRCR